MSDAAPFYIGSEIYRQPAFGSNHPLNIVRHAAVVDLLRMLGWLDETQFHESRPASVEQLLEFHSRAYVRALQYANATGKVEPDVLPRLVAMQASERDAAVRDPSGNMVRISRPR